MGIPVLILGNSGAGKTCSLRNFADAAVINVIGKPMPFKSEKRNIIVKDDMKEITRIIKDCKAASVVIDDAGYCLTNYYKRNAYARDFSVYTDLALAFSGMVEAAQSAPHNHITYFIMHTEETARGVLQPLTVGKLLNEKLNLAGMFSIVFLAKYENGRYVFQTQTAGNDPAKTPMEMFAERDVENDLKVIDGVIREYYFGKEKK
jgi:hypothetical protein